jgi:hypothetical protein
MISEKGNPASGSAGKRRRMGCENQGLSLLTYIFQGVQDFRRHFGIEGGGGFVEEKDFRIVSKGPGEGDSLALPA